MDGWGQVNGILRTMLQDLFEADRKGARRDKLARAHGYTDGYMRALVDLELVTEKQLLQLVLEERRKSSDKPLTDSGKPERRFVKVQPVAAPVIESFANV